MLPPSGDTLETPATSTEELQGDSRITAAVALALSECMLSRLTLYCPGPDVNAGLAGIPEVQTIYIDDGLPHDTLQTMQSIGEAHTTKVVSYSQRRSSRWLPGRLIDVLCLFPSPEINEDKIVSTTAMAAGALVIWVGGSSERPHGLQDHYGMSLIGTVSVSNDAEPVLADGDIHGHFAFKSYDELTEEERTAFLESVNVPAAEDGEWAQLYSKLMHRRFDGSTYQLPYQCNEPALFVYRRMPRH